MFTEISAAGRGTIPREAERRERLAAYFLSAPPVQVQTPDQRAGHLARLRELGTLENEEILAAAGTEQPLVWGDPLLLLHNLLVGAQQLAATVGQPVLVFPARGISIRFTARLHPRLLCAAAVNMLRMACTAAPRCPVWLRMEEQAAALTVSVTAQAPFYERQGAAVIQESARLHGGRLTLGQNRMEFSCARAQEPPAGVQRYVPPSAAAFLQDELSMLWTGFYAWLSEEAPAAPSDEPVDDFDAPEDGSGAAALLRSPQAKHSASAPTIISGREATPPA